MATYESVRYQFTGANIDSASISAPTIANGSVTNTEFQTVDTSTSIQTQLNTKFSASGGTFTGNVTVADSTDLNIGNGNDIVIRSDGTTGYIKSNALVMEDNSGADYMTFTTNGAVTMTHGGNTKIATSATGATVTGTLAATALTGTGAGITALAAGNITAGGTLPALVGTALTSLNAANLTGTYPALNGASITSLNASNLASGTIPNGRYGTPTFSGSNLTSLNASNISSGTINSARLPGGLGKVLQVVSTNTQSHMSSTTSSYTDVTGLNVSITPSATNSKVLVVCNIGVVDDGTGSNGSYAFRLLRAGTAIGNGTGGGQTNAIAGLGQSTNNYDNFMIHFLDSPNTTSSTQYKLQFRGLYNPNIRINRSQDNNAPWGIASSASITAVEIGA